MYGAALAISGNHWLYLVIFGMPLEQYYFELYSRVLLTMYDNIKLCNHQTLRTMIIDDMSNIKDTVYMSGSHIQE